MNYISQGNSLSPESYVELFTLDASFLVVGTAVGSTYYITNSNPEPPYGAVTSPNGIVFGGNNYLSLPVQLDGVDTHGDGTASGKPTLSVSNVNQFFLAAILSLGDLVGMKVIRTRTFYTYCDNGATPDTSQVYPPNTWVVTKKAGQSKNGIQWELSNYLDVPGVKLPRLQIFTDSVAGQIAFPGVSRLMM